MLLFAFSLLYDRLYSIMNTTISIHQAQENISLILEQVVKKKYTAIIEDKGKPVAKIVPIASEARLQKATGANVIEQSFGILPDFPDVRIARIFRRTHTSL